MRAASSLQRHDPDGHLNGALLKDGTIVRMPPPDAERHAVSLAVGGSLSMARGDGMSGPLGKVIAAREIGPSRTQLTKIGEPRFKRRDAIILQRENSTRFRTMEAAHQNVQNESGVRL